MARNGKGRIHTAGQTTTSDLLTLSEAATYLKLSERSVRRLIKDGDLPAFRIGRSGPFRLRLDDVKSALTPVEDVDEGDDDDSFIRQSVWGRS